MEQNNFLHEGLEDQLLGTVSPSIHTARLPHMVPHDGYHASCVTWTLITSPRHCRLEDYPLHTHPGFVSSISRVYGEKECTGRRWWRPIGVIRRVMDDEILSQRSVYLERIGYSHILLRVDRLVAPRSIYNVFAEIDPL